MDMGPIYLMDVNQTFSFQADLYMTFPRLSNYNCLLLINVRIVFLHCIHTPLSCTASVCCKFLTHGISILSNDRCNSLCAKHPVEIICALQMSMALSASFSLSSSHHLSQFCCCDLKWKQTRLEFLKPHRRKSQYLWIVKSVLNRRRSSSVSEDGATEPARILLEKLFAQTQKLEEQLGRDPYSPHVAELGVNLGVLESDLQIALAALKKKEEDLQHAERKVLLEYKKINVARKDLERREEKIVAAKMKHEKLEEELRLANVDLASQATEIGDLTLLLKERDQEISASQSALSAKEEEIIKMKLELEKKSEEAAIFESELRSKAILLEKANRILEKQVVELQQLQGAMQKKDDELEMSISMQKNDAEKLKVAEAKLEKQTMDWLVAQVELKKLAAGTSKHVGDANEAEFVTVRKLLSDVRSDLISSQKTLASSRQKIESQDQLLEMQLTELDEQRRSIMSYMKNLRDVEVEVESEKAKLRVAEAQNKELERELSLEKELVSELQKELDKERSSLKQAIVEISTLKEEIDRKSAAFEQSQTLLKAKESELVEARLEIQHFKSEHASLELILEEKDLEFSNAKMMLEEVNRQIDELNGILFSREEELIQAMSMLKEKDEHVQTIEHDLSNAKLKFSEAEMVVEKIVDLTKEVVLSFDADEGYHAMGPLDQNIDRLKPPLLDGFGDSFKWQKKQLEAELKFTRESLKEKEIEVLTAQKDLTIKDEELKTVLRKLDAREKEITELKGHKDDLKQLYALAQERIGEKSVGDLAIEKLQFEVAQLEVEAATSALQKIAEMSRQLLSKADSCVEAADYDTSLYKQANTEARINTINGNKCSIEVRSEVSRLLSLTQQLVGEANVAGAMSQ